MKPKVKKDPQRVRNAAQDMTLPALAAARAIRAVDGKTVETKLEIPALVQCLGEQAATVNAGDMRLVETMLANQATVLQSLFARLTEIGMAAEYLPTLETFLRIALRAQAQCTRTLEVLAAVKNPPVVIARQANIAQQQQVNNNMAALARAGNRVIRPAGAVAVAGCPRARVIEKAPTQLLEELPRERLDCGTPATASGVDSHLEAVGAVNRPPD